MALLELDKVDTWSNGDLGDDRDRSDQGGKRSMHTKDTSSCFLSVERGKQQGQVYELHQEVVKIGRTAGNDFMLDDPTVSQLHARIVRLEDGT